MLPRCARNLQHAPGVQLHRDAPRAAARRQGDKQSRLHLASAVPAELAWASGVGAGDLQAAAVEAPQTIPG